jgi:limonene-1,2-epoxide hydrolase
LQNGKQAPGAPDIRVPAGAIRAPSAGLRPPFKRACRIMKGRESMSPEEVVNAFCDALNRDLESSLVYIAEDCVYQNMPFPPVTGPAGVRETLAGFFELTGPVRIETLRQCASGNFVMNERIDHFAPPQGKAFGLPVAGAFEVTGDKITAWRDYFCMQQFRDGTGLSF